MKKCLIHTIKLLPRQQQNVHEWTHVAVTYSAVAHDHLKVFVNSVGKTLYLIFNFYFCDSYFIYMFLFEFLLLYIFVGFAHIFSIIISMEFCSIIDVYIS